MTRCRGCPDFEFWIRRGGSLALPIWLGLPDGDGNSFNGVGSEAIEKAADHAKTGLSGGDSDANPPVFRLLGHVPERRHLLVLMLKAVGSDLAGQMRLLLPGDLGLRRQHFAQPLDNATDDLANAGLRDLVFVGLRPGLAAGDVDSLVDFEITFGGGNLG